MIMNQEYISIELEYGNGSAELEAWPHEGEVGPVFFRWNGGATYGNNTLAVKLHNESWETFFARQDPDWELTPLMKELAATLEKEWTKQVN